MTLIDRARLAEQIIKDLGNPSLVTVSFTPYWIEIQTHRPLGGIDYRMSKTSAGTHYRYEYREGDEGVSLSCWLAAEEAAA